MVTLSISITRSSHVLNLAVYLTFYDIKVLFFYVYYMIYIHFALLLRSWKKRKELDDKVCKLKFFSLLLNCQKCKALCFTFAKMKAGWEDAFLN